MKGSYALIIRLNRAKRLTVGRLGEFYFPAGHYIYLGSALNGLESRVRRHLRRDKKLHWHIDYLTAVAGVCQVWWVGDGVHRECLWAQEVLERGATAIAPGFGSSDCRCPTHLLYVEDWTGRGWDGCGRRLWAGRPATVPRVSIRHRQRKTPKA